MVQLAIVADDRDGVVVQALLQLGPLAALIELLHPDPEARPGEIVRVGFRGDSIVFVREMADVELASAQPPGRDVKSSHQRFERHRELASWACFRPMKSGWRPRNAARGRLP